MASVGPQVLDSYKAGEDLRTKQYYFVKGNATDHTIAICGAEEQATGVLQNKPNTGEWATVCIGGKTKVVVGSGGVSANDPIACDSAGKAGDAAAAEGFVLGRAEQDGDENDKIEMDFFKYQLSASIA